MVDNFIDTPAEPANDGLQVAAAILLGLAAILTAMSGYYSAIKGGDSADVRADSGRTLADANFYFNKDTQQFSEDQNIFVEYATANFEGDTDRADYLITLMRPELQDAVEWWESEDDAITPFDDADGNPYFAEGAQVDLDEANRLQARADAQVDRAAELDAKGDQFDLATGVLALTLFFGGVGTLFKSRRVATAMLAMAAVGLAGGAALAVTAF